MKPFFKKALPAWLLILSLFLFAACAGLSGDEKSGGGHSKDTGGTVETTDKTVETTGKPDPAPSEVPVITVSDVGLASWTGSGRFLYKLDGGAEVETTSNVLQLTDGQTLTVKTVDPASDWSAEVTYHAPTGWNDYTGAIKDGILLSLNDCDLLPFFLPSGGWQQASLYSRYGSGAVKTALAKESDLPALTAQWIDAATAAGFLYNTVSPSGMTVYENQTTGVLISYSVSGLEFLYTFQGTRPVLPAPAVSVNETGLASWEPVTGAVGYRVKIDYGTPADTQETSAQLTAGQTISVSAVGDGVEYDSGAYSRGVAFGEAAVLAMPESWAELDPVIAGEIAGVLNDPADLPVFVPCLESNGTLTKNWNLHGSGYLVAAISDADDMAQTVDRWIAVVTGAGFLFKEEQPSSSDPSVVFEYYENYATGVLASYCVNHETNFQYSYQQLLPAPTLPAPSVLFDSTGNAIWAPIKGAVSYTYRIDGGTEVTGTETSVALTVGQSITVRANGNGVDALTGEFSAARTYTTDAEVPAKADLAKYHSDLGYEMLGKMENGTNLQALYDAIDELAYAFHVDTGKDLTVAQPTDPCRFGSVDFDALGVADTELQHVLELYRNDHPLYYWFSTAYQNDSTTLYLCIGDEFKTGSDRASLNTLIMTALSERAEAVKTLESDEDVVKACHDWLVSNLTYAFKNDGVTPEDAFWAHTVVGAFRNNTGVCETYARTFTLLLNQSGIDCYLVTGYAGENHAWNLVCLDGLWYWVDVTWDDPVPDMGGISYTYYLVKDGGMTDHEADEWYILPARAE